MPQKLLNEGPQTKIQKLHMKKLPDLKKQSQKNISRPLEYQINKEQIWLNYGHSLKTNRYIFDIRNKD